MSRRAALAAFALVAATTLGSPDALAHSRSVSYSTWQIDDRGAHVTLRMALLEVSRLSPDAGRSAGLDALLDAGLARYWTDHLQLWAGGERCGVAEAPRALSAPDGKAAFEWRVDCGGRPPDEIVSTLFLDVAPGHLHFARLRAPDAAALQTVERVLSILEPAWSLDAGGDASEAVGSSLAAYVMLGIEHIATGADHLVFVFALLLLASRLREVATIVTGFTIAHSLTLSSAVLGGLRPESHAVESLIGLSIALVAAENAWLRAGRPRRVPAAIALALLAMAALAAVDVGALPVAIPLGLIAFSLCYFAILARVERPIRFRIAISFVFGLVHGFGFAGVLEEIALPQDRLVQALFGFNLGVEIGQLVAVAALWPALLALARFREGRLHGAVVDASTAIVCALGVFWFVSRAYAIS